jgi:rhodanese-related sulfurtransferase
MSISTIQALEFLERKNTGAIVIDIRTPEEIQSGKISDAREMNCYDHDFQKQVSKLDISKEYLLYCRSGIRSGQVLTIFKDMGFQNVHDLAGGIGDWVKTGNRLV